MEAAEDRRLRPSERLTKSAEYRRVLQRGVRLDGRLFNLVGVPNQRPHHRLGLTVSRRVGGAVERNRAKRLLREAFRRRGRPQAVHCDLVVVAKREILACSLSDLDLEFAKSLERLERRLAGRRSSDRPGPDPPR